MGIVRRQGIQNLFFLYGGVVLGYLNKVVLFAKILSQEEYGLVELILGVSVILMELVRLGINPIFIRFYPFFKGSGDREKEFNSLAILYPIVGLAVATVLLLVFRRPIEGYYQENSALFSENYLYVIPLMIFMSLSEILVGLLRVLFKTVLPNAIKEVMLRAWQTVLILLFSFDVIGFEWFLNLFIIGYVIQFVGLLAYLVFLNKFTFKIRWGFFRTRIFRYIFLYGLFGLLNNAASRLVNRLDIVMLGLLLGLADTAVYGLAYYIGLIVSVPGKSIGGIAVPIIAESVKTRDFEKISNIYKKSSLSNVIMGGLLFLGIWVNIDFLFQILPDKFAEGKWVVFFIGVSKLFDLATSLNGTIIVASKHFRFDLYANLFLMILAVITNILLIPIYGVTGAAIATAISIFLHNILKVGFVHWKFGLSPFTPQTLLTIAIGGVVYGVSWLIPVTGQPYLDIVIHSTIVGGLFLGLILPMKLFPELNDTLWMILSKTGVKRKKK